MIRLIIFLLLKFVLGAESGASFSWSAKWQKTTVLGFNLQQLPEILDGVLLAFLAMQGYQNLGLDWPFLWEVGLFLAVGLISYAGILSATWMFLDWEGKNPPNTERNATLKPIVDFIADKFGWKLGTEGYAWTAATVKGTIITLPMGGLGGLLFASGYEIGSWFKRKNRERFLPSWLKAHAISEGMSFVGVGLYAIVFLEITKLIGN